MKITSIQRSNINTRIDFEYTYPEQGGQYIYLNSPGTQNAYYIKANGEKFLLIETEGIGNRDGITAAYQDEPVKFSAYFEPIPKVVDRIDLIEGVSGSWNFYGVELNNTKSDDALFNSSFEISKSFTKNFSFIYAIDTTTEPLEWQKFTSNIKFTFNKENKRLIATKEDVEGIWLDIYFTEFITFDSEKETYVYGGFNKKTNSSCAVLLYLDGNIGIQMHKESDKGEMGAIKFEFRN